MPSNLPSKPMGAGKLYSGLPGKIQPGKNLKRSRKQQSRQGEKTITRENQRIKRKDPEMEGFSTPCMKAMQTYSGAI